MWSGERPSEKGEDTGWGEHCEISDITNNNNNKKREQSEDDIELDIQDYGQHHRKDESTGDIYFQHSGKPINQTDFKGINTSQISFVISFWFNFEIEKTLLSMTNLRP